MALILNIDTSQDTACVSLALDGEVITAATNESQKDHAAWIHGAVEKIFAQAEHPINEMAAVGLSNGPGSYTGLRIGLATAKGLCYALKIPLITVGTLEVMARNALEALGQFGKNGSEPEFGDGLICPMIDARRMEVFTAVYDNQLNEIEKPQALVLTPASFDHLVGRQKILFLGNGSEKFRQVCQNLDNAIFRNFPLNPSALSMITYRNFIGNNFAALAYTEPLYLKEAYTVKKADGQAGPRN